MGPRADFRFAAEQYHRGDLRAGRRHHRPQYGGHQGGAGRPAAACGVLLQAGRGGGSLRFRRGRRCPVRQADIPSSACLRRYSRQYARRGQGELGSPETPQEKPQERHAGRRTPLASGHGQGFPRGRESRRDGFRLAAARGCVGQGEGGDRGGRSRDAFGSPRQPGEARRRIRRPVLRAGQCVAALRHRPRIGAGTYEQEVHPPLQLHGGKGCRRRTYAPRASDRKDGGVLAGGQTRRDI